MIKGLWNTAIKNVSETQKLLISDKKKSAATFLGKSLTDVKSVASDKFNNALSKGYDELQKKSLTGAIKAKKTAEVLQKRAIQNINIKSMEGIRNTVLAAPRTIADSSRSVIKSLDPRERARRLRNRIIFLAFGGLFVYGLSTSIPQGVAYYALQREKLYKEK